MRDAASEGSVRRLAAGERGLLLGHLLRLDAEGRRLRFGGSAGEAHARAYCRRLDLRRSLVLGWFVGGEPRAVGELKPIGAAGTSAEVALSVEGAFRGRGVGTELCRRLLVRARNRLVGRVHMLCLRDNARAQRIARRLGGTLAFHPGEVEARLDLRWPDPLSGLEEWLDEAAAALAAAALAGPAAARQ